MKKFFKLLFVLAFIAGGLYFVNSYYNHFITEQIEDIFKKPVETTVNAVDKTESKPTIGEQIYNQLTDTEQQAFDSIYNAVSKCKSSVIIYSDIETQRLFDIVNLVAAQHPEIFWWNGSCSLISGGILKFEYICTESEIAQTNEKIESRAKEIFEQINPQGDDFEKSLAIFDYIVLHTTYNNDAVGNMEEHPQSSTIEGVFLNASAICSGYAKAYQYLLAMAGIDSIFVSGAAQTPNGENGHAWILQEAEGFYYYTDPTWGDSYESSGKNNFVSHTYFCTTSDEISSTHQYNDKCYQIFKTENDCNSYFKRKGLCFEQYNLNTIKSAIKSEIKSNPVGIEIQFTSDEEYRTAISKLFEDEEIYYILLSADFIAKDIETNAISYNTDDEHNVIAIIFEKKS